MMDDDPLEFEIDRERLESYQLSSTLLAPTIFPLITPFGLFFGIGLVLAAIWWFKFARPYAHAHAATIRYWIDTGKILRIEYGTIVKQSISLPMDRITSISITQGPIMNWHGICALDIRTTDFPPRNWMRLYALKSPEKVRDILLDERRKALREIQAERYA